MVCANEAFGIDFEAEIAVITGDVPMQTSADDAVESVRLIMLANDVSLRNLIPERVGQRLWVFAKQTRHRLQPRGCDARRAG